MYTIELARMRFERILGAIPEWTELTQLLSASDADAPKSSIMASAFSAALEFAKDGRLELRQLAPFEPIFVKARQRTDERDEK